MRRNGTVLNRRHSVQVRRLLIATGLAALVVSGSVVAALADTPVTGVTLTGRVVGPDGTAVRGVSVTPQLDGGSLPAAVTGADGTYALRDLVPGSYALLVGARPDTGLLSGYYPDGRSPQVPQRLTVSTTSPQVVPDIRLQRGATVAGTVRRPDGTPVPRADVWVDLVGPGGYSFPATTDAYGRYRAIGVRDGRVTVWAGSTRNEEWGSDYSGIGTFYAGAAGTPRRTQAAQVATTAGGALTGIDIALPPRGTEPSALAMTLSPARPTFGQPVTVTVQASGAAGTPTGTIDLAANGLHDDAVLDGQGRATFTFTPDAGTDYVELTAAYDGSATYAAATGAIDFRPGAQLVETGAAPKVTSASPSTVSAAGGARVTLTGTGFDSTASVSVDGVAAKDVVVDSATSLRATVPAHVAGAAPVVVTTSTGGPSPATSLTYALEPTTLTLTTSAGSVAVGKPVTFTATVAAAAGVPAGPVRFRVDGGTAVERSTVGGVATYASSTLTAGTHTVTATFAGDGTHRSSTASVTQVVVVPPSPTVSAVWPAVLTTDGGVRVTVTGAGLSDATAVTFGGTPGTGIQVLSSTRLTVVAPARAAGAATVRVTTPAGTSTTSPSFLFVDTSDGMVSQTPQRAEFRREVAPYTPVCLQITGTNGVPVGASGVVLNVTTVSPVAPGHVIVYPDTDGNGATPAPVGSTVNFEPGADVANAAFVQLPDNGKVCYLTRSGGSAGVVLDVTGFTMPDAGIVTQPSQRLVDTRPGAYRVGSVAGPVAPRTVQTVQVRGEAGVPDDATAVILSAVVTNVTAPGNLRIFPAGQDVPVASVVNYAPGKDKATATIVGLPASGKISFYSDTNASTSSSPVQVVLDVTGYIVGDSTYTALPPKRVLDSRPGAEHVGTIPGALAARTAYQVHLPGKGGIPTDATSVVLNVAAIGPSSVGNLRVYPNRAGSTTPPAASTINYVPGRAISNLVVVALPDDGIINVYSDMFAGGEVGVAIDVVGYVPGD